MLTSGSSVAICLAWSAIFRTNNRIQHGDAGRQPVMDGASHGAAMFKAKVSGKPFSDPFLRLVTMDGASSSRAWRPPDS